MRSMSCHCLFRADRINYCGKKAGKDLPIHREATSSFMKTKYSTGGIRWQTGKFGKPGGIDATALRVAEMRAKDELDLLDDEINKTKSGEKKERLLQKRAKIRTARDKRMTSKAAELRAHRQMAKAKLEREK